MALEGQVTEHHRFLLRQLYDHLLFTESKRKQIEEEIERRMLPFQDEVLRLCTIPGVDRVTAWGLLAEIGLDMNQFPSSAHLASWACLRFKRHLAMSPARLEVRMDSLLPFP